MSINAGINKFFPMLISRTDSCVHVLATLDEGGNETLAHSLIDCWPVKQNHIIATLGHQSGPMLERFERLGILDSLPMGWPISLSRLFATLLWLLRVKPAAIISYTFNVQVLPFCVLAKLCGCKNIFVRVGNPPPCSPRAKSRCRWLVRLFRWSRIPLMSCSVAVHRQLSVLATLPEGSKPMLNGCDIAKISASATASRSSRSVNDLKRIVMVARLDPIKDQATLLRAFALVKQLNWQLQLVGDGSDESFLKTLAMELNLNIEQVFLGRRNGISELLGRADIFAFSTTPAEGFGIVLIEAMAAGLPILASDVPCCREVLLDGAAGQLLPAGNVPAWSKSLKLLMNSPSLRDELSACSKASAHYYDIKDVAARWYGLLR